MGDSVEIEFMIFILLVRPHTILHHISADLSKNADMHTRCERFGWVGSQELPAIVLVSPTRGLWTVHYQNVEVMVRYDNGPDLGCGVKRSTESGRKKF